MTWPEALNLPVASIVNQQLKLIDLIRATTPSRADERLLRDAVLYVTVKATIKTANCNIMPFANDLYNVVELLVLEVEVKPTYLKNHLRVARLMNAIPHPVVLWLTDGAQYKLVLQEKRVNQADTKRRTAGAVLVSPTLPAQPLTEAEFLFRHLLDFQQQDALNLKALYDSYLQALLALLVSSVIGKTAKRNPAMVQQDLDTWSKLMILQSQRTLESKTRYFNIRDQDAQNQRVWDLDIQITQLIDQLKANLRP